MPVVPFSYHLCMKKDGPRENRVPIMLSDAELQAIDDWRFGNRIGTRSDAIRRLAQIGLSFDAQSDTIREASERLTRFLFRGAGGYFVDKMEAVRADPDGERKFADFLKAIGPDGQKVFAMAAAGIGGLLQLNSLISHVVGVARVFRTPRGSVDDAVQEAEDATSANAEVLASLQRFLEATLDDANSVDTLSLLRSAKVPTPPIEHDK